VSQQVIGSCVNVLFAFPFLQYVDQLCLQRFSKKKVTMNTQKENMTTPLSVTPKEST